MGHAEDAVEELHRQRGRERDALGALEAEELRRLLAEHDVQRRDDGEGDDEGDDVDAASRETPALASGSSSMCATVGSPIQPRPSEASVMPSCDAER